MSNRMLKCGQCKILGIIVDGSLYRREINKMGNNLLNCSNFRFNVIIHLRWRSLYFFLPYYFLFRSLQIVAILLSLKIVKLSCLNPINVMTPHLNLIAMKCVIALLHVLQKSWLTSPTPFQTFLSILFLVFPATTNILRI